MSQNTNLNVSPYFDDFNESRNYNKVLFKPGYPIQARELTTLQSILQNQVERFGQHFFKEGSIVVPGGTFYDDSYFAVRISPFFLNIAVSNYTSVLSDKKIEIEGELSGVRATVVNRILSTESVDGHDTLYVKYTRSGRDGITRTFQDGENLITLSDVEYSSTSIEANNQIATCIASEATKVGSSFSVNEGIYFVRGHFVKVPSSTVILDQYSNTPSYRVGLLVNEETISASDKYSDLYDNAKGFSNESAPGADRFKISTTLHKKLISDNNDIDFVELMRIEDGIIRERKEVTEYNIFKDELARRTYDESGDYYIRPFAIDVRESLNDRISNRGIYLNTQTTQNGNIPSDDILTLQISPGKAYVRGYEIDKISTTSLDVLKPRTAKLKENVSVPIRVGKYIELDSIQGSPTIGLTTAIKLLGNRLEREGLTSEFRSQRKGATGMPSESGHIGYARIYDYNPKSAVGTGMTGGVYEARLFDIQTFTTIGVAHTVRNIKAKAAVGDYIQGKYSGASGIIEIVATTPVADDGLTLNDVQGVFQLNEPLILNGLDAGSGITTITDYDFSDIKAVNSHAGVGGGSTTFCANLRLDRKKNVFKDGTEFRITTASGNVTSSAYSDFTGLVKVGDVISYSTVDAGSTEIWNRVKSVDGSSFTVEAISDVTGVNQGSLISGNPTPTDLNVQIPTLFESDDPGYRIKLQDENIASINLLDTSYIVRKQITANVSNVASVDFDLNTLSDSDNLYYEPFTVSNYQLTIANYEEPLTEAMVTIDADLKKVTITSMSRTGTAKLTATVKRSRLTSKDKDIVRCSSLIINRSSDVSSGITTFTKNDGLTYSKVYGTRIQDKEISLNVPDIHRVLAIFESDDSTNPTLPSITASDQSATFSNNVIVGEQVLGSTSGALGRVVSIDSGTKISFVYENDKKFETGERITLQTSGILSTINILIRGDRNISKSYTLDKGHRYEFADYGRILRNDESSEPTRRLRIIFDYFSTSESSGVLETVNSYNKVNYGAEIPFVIDRRASDYIDIRPRVKALAANPDSCPFAFSARDFNPSSSETVVSNKSLIADYSYYQGRVDRLYLSKDGIFEIKKGQPSDEPRPTLPNDESFEVAVISLPPYVYNATEDVSVRTIPHKRFTMKDIGGLEHRLKTLEEYTTLSLLETDTKNLAIKDPNTGLDKFKSGFFVDNFRNHASHNLTGDSYFDIDMQRGECRPRSTERNIGLMVETVSTAADPVNADYRWAEDFSDSNVTRKGAALTLDYTTEVFVEQPFATATENLNPFHIALFAGSLTLNPETDFWIEEVPLGTPDVFRIDSTFNAIADLLQIEDRENGGMASSFWNTHETTWGGTEVVGTDVSSTLISAGEVTEERLRGRGRREIRRQEQTVRQNITETLERSGVEREFGLELTVGEDLIDLGTKVVGVDVLYNCRTRNIEIVGKRLKPNTRYYVFMENIDVTEYCVPKLLPVTMTRGSFETGDILESANPAGSGVASILFRVAQSNHKLGPYNAATENYDISPYDGLSIPSLYSSTSNIVNVDTAGLAMHTKPDHLGWVKSGMALASKSGNGEATVGSLELMSDEKGSLILSLHIPDPKIASNPKFTTGQNTIRLTTSSVNASKLDPGESSAETTYFATGHKQTTQEQAISIKTPQIERKATGVETSVTRIETRTRTETTTQNVVISDTGWYDPLAQSFLVSRSEYQDGIFITGGDLFFKTKDERNPVTVQIRTMRDGSPTTTIVPFGEIEIDPSSVNLSDDSSVATPFEFETPVYLQGGNEYALVLVAPSEKYLTFITRMGEEDLILNAVSNTQPYLGSLFKSQNSSTWTPSQSEDLKFTLRKANFVTNTNSTVTLYNTELPLGLIRRDNPATSYSKRSFISIGTTAGPSGSFTFEPGEELIQKESGTENIRATGRLLASGGPIDFGLQSINYVPNTGVSLADVGNGPYTGIGFTSLTGFGGGAEATITITNNVVTKIDCTERGSGYQIGDLLEMEGKLGTTKGTKIQAVVGAAKSTNLIVVDDITDKFVDGQDIFYVDQAGTRHTLAAAGIGVNNDPIRDGSTLLIDHHNHGMHSSTNKVTIKDFASDVPSTTLTSNIVEDTSTISVADGSLFTTFEGATVGAGLTGYIKVDNEIISYNSISGNDIIISSSNRSVDSSLKSIHNSGATVEKYEFNGVSLRRINREHNVSTNERTFNSYYINLVDKHVSFNTTKAGGGDQLKASQNIPFEVIDPRITTVSPTGTTVNARIKTTSGTSISGSEASFQDKGYENVALNKMNFLDNPRIIASKVNEYGLLNNQKSFALELILSTNNKNVSPVIDLDTTNIIAISNLVDDKVTNFATASGPRISGSDPNSAIYETKRINLEFASNSMYVQFDGHREGDADFHVFYKLFRNDSSDVQQIYVPFNGDGSPDKVVKSNTTINGFSEYKYTAENTPHFNGFMIKVVMTSKNQAKPPRLKNFRSIALRSFAII